MKKCYPFDVQRFRHDNRLSPETFGRLIGKDSQHTQMLEWGELPGLSTYEHSRLCARYGKGEVARYYRL